MGVCGALDAFIACVVNALTANTHGPHLGIMAGGSIIGGIKETQDMLDFCGRHNIVSMIELIPAAYANRVRRSLDTTPRHIHRRPI